MPRKNVEIQSRGINRNSIYFEEFERIAKRLRLRICQLRQENGLTQEQMQDFELNLRQFQRIEAGETKNITLANLFKIAKAFRINLSEMLKAVE